MHCGIAEADINIMRKVLDKIWHNLRAEFNVSCATVDNNAIVVEALGKNSSNTSSSSNTSTSSTSSTNNNNNYSTTAATDKIISTTLMSTNKRKKIKINR